MRKINIYYVMVYIDPDKIWRCVGVFTDRDKEKMKQLVNLLKESGNKVKIKRHMR